MTKRIIKSLVTAVLFAAFAAGAALAAPPEGGEYPPPEERKEKTKKRIRTLKMWKLVEELDLDEETSAKLFPIINKHNKRRDDLERELKDRIDALGSAVDGGDNAEMEAGIARVEEIHRRMKSVKEEKFQEVKRVLTIKQQARYLLFEVKFREEIRHLIGRQDRRGSRPQRQQER
jgi:Spy/CpxP family protein refolding chaperone